MPAKKKILTEEMHKEDGGLKVDFFVKPHPNDPSVKMLEIYTSVPDELAGKLAGKTVSLSKKTGGCLFEIKDFSVHNDHLGLFHSEEELNKFISRVQKDVVQVLKEAGCSVNEMSSVVPAAELAEKTKNTSNLKDEKDDNTKPNDDADELKIGDTVKVKSGELAGKTGKIVKISEIITIGVDFGEIIIGMTHDLDGKLSSNTGIIS